MERFNQRQGFLVSATIHLMILTMLSAHKPAGPKPFEAETLPEEIRNARRVILPPPEVLRQLLPRTMQPPPPRPAGPPRDASPPPEPQAKAKDRISIGPPSDERAKVLELRREDDLTKTPKGLPNAVPSAAPSAPPRPVTIDGARPAAPERPGTEGPLLPPGTGPDATARGEDGSRLRPGDPDRGPSIASTLRDLEQRWQQTGPRGLPTGTGQQMGPLYFDPEGADFTVWVNHFKNEVYRNWIVPQAAMLGFGGHVDIVFTVHRDGRLTGLKMLKSSGTASLDKAAMNSLLGSRLLALPPDYGPPSVTMQVTFFYNEGPQGS
ncbi:MAG: TonB family protein [Vicinamibacteria bacterium]